LSPSSTLTLYLIGCSTELSDFTLQLIQIAKQGKVLMSNTSKASSTKPTKSHLSSLQLTEQHKVQRQDPIIQRRNKLIETNN